MRFSIVVPIFNTEKFIDECIQSVLNQTYDDYELILVDDGSTDKSGLICDEYAKKYAQIKVFHKENSGQIDSRNKGVMEARGDYIVFLDSDDLLDSNALKTIHEKINQYNCDMVIYSIDRFHYSSESIGFDKRKDMVISDIKILSKILLSSEEYNSVCRKAIKACFLHNMNFIDYLSVRYGEDLLQTLDILSQNPKTVIINDVLYYYRQNPVSITNHILIDRCVVDAIIVRGVVYQWILAHNILNSAEMYDYKGIATKFLSNVVFLVARNQCTFSKKKELFNSIKQSDYYRNFISFGKKNYSRLGKKAIPWFLFKISCYRILCWIFALWDQFNNKKSVN